MISIKNLLNSYVMCIGRMEYPESAWDLSNL
jgi:hypothetical protein